PLFQQAVSWIRVCPASLRRPPRRAFPPVHGSEERSENLRRRHVLSTVRTLCQSDHLCHSIGELAVRPGLARRSGPYLSLTGWQRWTPPRSRRLPVRTQKSVDAPGRGSKATFSDDLQRASVTELSGRVTCGHRSVRSGGITAS